MILEKTFSLTVNKHSLYNDERVSKLVKERIEKDRKNKRQNESENKDKKERETETKDKG